RAASRVRLRTATAARSPLSSRRHSRDGPAMRRLCVFGGSAEGTRPAYADAARALGRELAKRGLGLVYGGGSVGLMGVLADTVLAEGGEVIGVIPGPLASRELAHAGLTELRV